MHHHPIADPEQELQTCEVLSAHWFVYFIMDPIQSLDHGFRIEGHCPGTREADYPPMELQPAKARQAQKQVGQGSLPPFVRPQLVSEERVGGCLTLVLVPLVGFVSSLPASGLASTATQAPHHRPLGYLQTTSPSAGATMSPVAYSPLS